MLTPRRSAPRRSPLRLVAAAALASFFALVTALAEPEPPRVTPVTGPDLARLIETADARAVLVNVWATWCAPCLEELPDVLRVRDELRADGLTVLLVSGDFPEQRAAAAKFLARLGVDFESYLKDGPDMEFIDALHAGWSGAMPATLVFERGGRLVHFEEGKATYEQMTAWAREALAATSGPARTKETP